MISDREQRAAAAQFAAAWLPRNLGDEKQHTHNFWLSLLSDVFGVEGAYRRFIDFERKVSLPGGKWGYIDGFIPDTKVLIEQKSRGKKLDEKIEQSDGTFLTPAEQGMRYAAAMNLSDQPRWIVACNFDTFEIYDQEKKGEPPVTVSLANFEEEFRRLSVIADRDLDAVPYETKLSVEAGSLIGKLYKALFDQYGDKVAESVRDHSLNVLCVRLAFCLYAEDSGLFGKHGLFHDYLRSYPAAKMREALVSLFEILDTPVEERDPYAEPELLAFPYVNGGLFREDKENPIVIPRFTDEIADILLKDASEGFDWRNISPTIFGAVFESTLNKETQRKGGMHYTSVENIHKVIDPLFLDELKAEYKAILGYKVIGQRDNALKKFLKKLGTLTFLDPACGSGNFLTETFLSLRRLENDALRILTHGQQAMSFDFELINVHIDQFYGIEINDFAVSVARTALWIAEHQMMLETEDIIQQDMDFLPLKSYSNIHEGNALRMDWGYVIPKEKLNYIMGNPPFVGARMMDQGSEKKKEIEEIFGDIKDVQDLDYVCGWFKKAAEFSKNSNIEIGFVATNSICQGAQVPILWGVLYKELGVHINYAYRTFKWSSEATDKAAVHCVIVGFSHKNKQHKTIFVADDSPLGFHSESAETIGPYLVPGSEDYVSAQKNAIYNVPKMSFGNQPRDGGHFVISSEERKELIKEDKSIEKYLKKYIGAEEFINKKERWCMWLKGVNPTEIAKNKILSRKVLAVKEFRLSSKAKTTNGYAKVPHLFAQITQPDNCDFLIVPSVSSENRRYIPIGFEPKSTISSNAVQIVPNASLYEFGVLTSNIHMGWMRTIAGRLKSDYRYSKEIVYNTFPWPSPTEKQREKIEKTAQAILDARAAQPEASFADMYGEKMYLYAALVKAHEANDKAVMAAYGFDPKMSEAEIVAELLKRYQARVEELEKEEATAAEKAAAEKAAEKARKKAEREAAKEIEKAKKKTEKLAAKLKAKSKA